MPFIEIRLPRPLAPEQKSRLVADVAQRTYQAVGSDPAIINVVLHELEPANISVGGRTSDLI